MTTRSEEVAALADVLAAFFEASSSDWYALATLVHDVQTIEAREHRLSARLICSLARGVFERTDKASVEDRTKAFYRALQKDYSGGNATSSSPSNATTA